jgi:hypothetical protein
MSGHADVSVMPGQSVTIYPNGDITMNSNNDINVGNEAKNLVIHGTSSIGQNFTFGSNVQVYGCIYAPNAAITLNSDTDILGRDDRRHHRAGFERGGALRRIPGSGGRHGWVGSEPLEGTADRGRTPGLRSELGV